jgi:hypothetical protein
MSSETVRFMNALYLEDLDTIKYMIEKEDFKLTPSISEEALSHNNEIADYISLKYIEQHNKGEIIIEEKEEKEKGFTNFTVPENSRQATKNFISDVNAWSKLSSQLNVSARMVAQAFDENSSDGIKYFCEFSKLIADTCEGFASKNI